MQPTINLDEYSLEQLKAFRGDEFMAREMALQQLNNANKNIEDCTNRINAKEAESAQAELDAQAAANAEPETTTTTTTVESQAAPQEPTTADVEQA